MPRQLSLIRPPTATSSAELWPPGTVPSMPTAEEFAGPTDGTVAVVDTQRVRQRRHPGQRERDSATPTCSPTTSRARAGGRAVRVASGSGVDRRSHRGLRPVGTVAVPDGPHRCRAGQPRWLVAIRSAASWSADDGTAEVWGRGAIDMLNATASMAVAFRRLATEGFRPRGTLIYFGVADEEAGGSGGRVPARPPLGRRRRDFVLTELGGWSQVGSDGRRRITVNVAEKGLAWMRLRVGGTPGHGSMPYGSDNALVTAAEVVRRLAAGPRPHLGDLWKPRRQPRHTCRLGADAH